MSILQPRRLGGPRLFAAPALFIFAAAASCQLISGLSDLETREGEATTSSATSTSSAMSTSATTMNTTASCEPGAVQDCYSGPPETNAVGICKPGTQTCSQDGTAWGECMGEVTPSPDPENCAAKVDLNCDGKASCTGAVSWVHLVSGFDKFVAHSVAVNSKGEVIIGGLFNGKINFGMTGLTSVDAEPDAFLAKLDPQGVVKWVQQFGGAGPDRVVSVAVAPDDSIVLTGDFTTAIAFDGNALISAQGGGDLFVAKLDTEGTAIWSAGYGDPAPQGGHGVTTDKAGNVVVSGFFTGTIDFGVGPMSAGLIDGFVAKIDPSGNALWSRQVGSGDSDEAYGVAIDSEGDVVVTGRVSGDGKFAGVDYTGNMGNGIFVGKLTGVDGQHAWGKVFGAPSTFQLGVGVTRAGSNGEVAVVGQFGDSVDFKNGTIISTVASPDMFVVKLDKNGAALWAKGFGNDGVEIAHDVSADDFGNITVGGSFQGVVDFGSPTTTFQGFAGNDGFAAKFDPSGNVLWAQQVLGPGDDGVYGVAVDALGASYVTGVGGIVVYLGGQQKQGTTNTSVFFAKLEP